MYKIMRHILSISAVFLAVFSGVAYGQSDEEIELKINSVTNIRHNGAIEVCGTAIHKEGVWPIVVTINHDESFYTTLTAPNNEWCQLIKRWTYKGEVAVTARTLESKSSTVEGSSLKR